LLRGRLDDLNTLFAALGIAQLDQPLVSLHLWVDHEAPAVRVLPDDCILSGERILWKSVTRPLCNPDWVSKDIYNIQLFRASNTEHLEHIDPLRRANGAIRCDKYTQVSEEARTDQCVANETLAVVFALGKLDDPIVTL
jgi:hypothetical protein